MHNILRSSLGERDARARHLSSWTASRAEFPVQVFPAGLTSCPTSGSIIDSLMVRRVPAHGGFLRTGIPMHGVGTRRNVRSTSINSPAKREVQRGASPAPAPAGLVPAPTLMPMLRLIRNRPILVVHTLHSPGDVSANEGAARTRTRPRQAQQSTVAAVRATQPLRHLRPGQRFYRAASWNSLMVHPRARARGFVRAGMGMPIVARRRDRRSASIHRSPARENAMRRSFLSTQAAWAGGFPSIPDDCARHSQRELLRDIRLCRRSSGILGPVPAHRQAGEGRLRDTEPLGGDLWATNVLAQIFAPSR